MAAIFPNEGVLRVADYVGRVASTADDNLDNATRPCPCRLSQLCLPWGTIECDDSKDTSAVIVPKGEPGFGS